MAQSYKILDEPEPGSYARFVVDPHWPFIAQLLGGSWVGLPWLAFNSVALGSATKSKELRAAVASPLLSLVVAVIGFSLVRVLGVQELAGSEAIASVLGLPDRAYAYVFAAIYVVKVWFLYRIVWQQSKSFSIFERLYGSSMNAIPFLALAYLLRPIVLSAAAKLSIYLYVVLL